MMLISCVPVVPACPQHMSNDVMWCHIYIYTTILQKQKQHQLTRRYQIHCDDHPRDIDPELCHDSHDYDDHLRYPGGCPVLVCF